MRVGECPIQLLPTRLVADSIPSRGGGHTVTPWGMTSTRKPRPSSPLMRARTAAAAGLSGGFFCGLLPVGAGA